MASTALPAAKAALIEVLKGTEGKGAKGLEGVPIAGGKEPERVSEYVWVYKGTAKRRFTSLGPTPPALDEDLSLFLRVLSIKGGTDIYEAETRAYELFEAVETALRSSIQLNGTVKWHRLEDVEGAPLQLDGKWAFHVLGTVTAFARI